MGLQGGGWEMREGVELTFLIRLIKPRRRGQVSDSRWKKGIVSL